jgi:hypothetical protein
MCVILTLSLRRGRTPAFRPRSQPSTSAREPGAPCPDLRTWASSEARPLSSNRPLNHASRGYHPCPASSNIDPYEDLAQTLSYHRTVKVERTLPSTLQPAFILRIWFVVSFIAISSFAQAQTQPATITGTVIDPSGAAIPKDQITLEAANGPALRATADTAGQFSIDTKPGKYTLHISAPGFESLSQPLTLEASKTLVTRLVLSISQGGPGVSIVFIPIEPEAPNPLTATLPLKPSLPLKLYPKYPKFSQ